MILIMPQAMPPEIAVNALGALPALLEEMNELARRVWWHYMKTMSWKRPASVPVGQVWLRFKGREVDGKPARRYQVRDMSEKYREQCLDLMQETFLRDEPICKALDVKSDQLSIESIRSNWERYLDQNVSLACFTEEDGEPVDLVAFNVITVRTRDEEQEDIEQVKGEKWKQVLKTLVAAESLVNVFDYFNVDAFLSSSGLTVLPGHRGQNIGAKMFEARKPLCKALGHITVTCTVYTAITSQVLARKCGFKTLATLPYKDMLLQGIDLTDCDTEAAELMAIKYDF